MGQPGGIGYEIGKSDKEWKVETDTLDNIEEKRLHNTVKSKVVLEEWIK